MANNFTSVGNEVQINLTPNQNNDQVDPDVATLTDGRFFVAFTDEFGANDDNIVGQFVNPDGTLSGGNIDIELDAGFQDEPAVAQRAAGAAVVVWDDEDASDEIHYAIVSSAGAVGPEQTILAGNFLSDPDVATLADGRSMVVARQVNGANSDIAFRFIDSAGAPSGVLDFVDNGADNQFSPAVAASGSNALVVYEDGPAGAATSIQARFFNGSGFASEVTLSSSDHDVFDPDVAALTDGRFIVVWANDENDNIEARLVSATGTPLGAVLTLEGNFGDEARVAALPDGGFIVTWRDFGLNIPPEVDGNDAAVVARRFDANGDPAGDPFLVNTGDSDSDQESPAIATNTTTGQTFIAWEDEHTFAGAGEDNDPTGLRGHAFVSSIDTVNGTGGDDVITTYNIGEPINGLDGDDLINGLGGNDTIHGGGGFDHIKGGLGDDQIFGDDGDDFLKGEDGDDLLVGGRGRDVLIGGSGKDSFDFNSLNKSRVGANRDVIQAFSRAEEDVIDLKTLDADTTTGGNQKFDLIGTAAFSGTAGELRFAGGLLQGDTDGNGIANFEIKVGGLHAPVNDDFLL